MYINSKCVYIYTRQYYVYIYIYTYMFPYLSKYSMRVLSVAQNAWHLVVVLAGGEFATLDYHVGSIRSGRLHKRQRSSVLKRKERRRPDAKPGIRWAIGGANPACIPYLSSVLKSTSTGNILWMVAKSCTGW